MSRSRLSLALSDGGLALPAGAPVAVFAPRAGMDLTALPRAHCDLITGFRPDADALEAAGWTTRLTPRAGVDYGAAVAVLPRAKARARALIAQAARVVRGGLLVIDGQKTDGIDSILREVRKRGPILGSFSKAHGKTIWLTADADVFADWASAGPEPVEGGHVTAPGVFSADGVDPASALLADALPERLGAHVVDAGAGWGYLARRMLVQCSGVERLDLVEADHDALECARLNVQDPRAAFHWADATRWRPDTACDAVVMNPPFHTGRAADADLGRAFIAAAAMMLAPHGQLWMVANRHLPYEAALSARFARTAELSGDARFKVLWAARPYRKAR
ncbi:methyltransferase [Sediminimonas sp.]|uniref:class I SAM-dependent methyltransferase n=1 Tax=Sediminimonas sp. TaxID=2823379 RepID=UPI0025D5090B|nr:methyltransferase [Sediminimonas sp.]